MKKIHILIGLLVLIMALAASWLWLGDNSSQILKNIANKCSATNDGMDNMEKRQLTLKNADGALLLFDTHIADDRSERAFGYQYICPDVIKKTTIFFVFEQSIIGRFHMRNVYAPLDIGFFDAKGNLIDVQTMYPYKENENTTYGPNKAFKFALEARAGFFRQHNLRAGKSSVQLTAIM